MYAEAISDLEKSNNEDARAKHAYELAYARAYLQAEGTIPQRESLTTLACDKERLATLIADGQREAVRARIKWIDKELSILQTRSATLRSEMQLSTLPEPQWTSTFKPY